MAEPRKMFRSLTPEEVEVRVGRVGRVDKDSSSWVSLLLYKDARCDQSILDETIGPMNWQRHHSRDNANCIVSIYDKDKGIWIEKEDTGTESNTEAQKGLASDSFKRACVNWGIGRELYTAPAIFVKQQGFDGKTNYEIGKNGKPKADGFFVDQMDVTEGRITYLRIKNRKLHNRVVFEWGEDQLQGQQSMDLPEPAPMPQGNTPPVPYERKNGPEIVQDARQQAIALFRQKYPTAHILALGAIFGTNKNTTDGEWAAILGRLQGEDFTAAVDKFMKEQEAKQNEQ